MSKSWKRLGKNVGAYGAALAGLAGAQAAQGAVMNLSPNPSSVVGDSTVTFGVGGLSLKQYNDSIGKSFKILGSIIGFSSVASGSTIATSQPFATTYPKFGTSATGSRTFAFKTSSNDVGWFKLNFGGAGGAVTYLGAAYETTPGTSIVAGETAPTPEPGTAALFGLGLLALGAAGIRKMRKKAAAAS